MEIEYANSNVEKYCTDLEYSIKKLGFQIVKPFKKRLDQLKAFINLDELMESRIGNPHWLKHNLEGYIGWNLDKHRRIILKPGITSEKIIIIGVVDYHGSKNEWIID